MSKKLFAVHGTAKGKNIFDVLPVAHVWADGPEDAEAKGKHIISMNPIYNQHFGDQVSAKESE